MTEPWHVLLIDDDPDYHEIFHDLLDIAFPDDGVLLTCAADGAAALQALREGRFDMAVVDYRLGAQTGIDLIAEVERHDIELPIVLLTGMDAERATEDGLAVGASDTLSKGELSPRRVHQSLRYAMESHRRRVTLRQTVAQMQRIEAGQAHFLSRLSHELRTPLNIVLGYAQLLKSGDSTPERVADMAASIEAGGLRLLELVENVLAATGAGLEGGRKVEPIELATWIELLAAPFRRQAAARGIALEIATEGNAGFASDRDLLSLAVRPILGNALKFSHRGAAVQVTVQATEILSITVRDSGIGMTAEALALAHLPFFQQDGSNTRSYEGLGLGLTVARSAIAALSGTLKMDSAVGIGTTAAIAIPRTAGYGRAGQGGEPHGSGDTRPA